MATSSISLAKLTRIQKYRLMEQLWEDLSQDEALFDTPAWHKQELEKREALVKSGQAEFVKWADAKKRLRAALS